MKKSLRIIGATILGLSMVASIGPVTTKAATVAMPVISFESNEKTASYVGQGATQKTVTFGNTLGKNALQVDYSIGDWPGITLKPIGATAWQIGSGNVLTFDVGNFMDRAQDLYIRLDMDNKDENGVIYKVSLPKNTYGKVGINGQTAATKWVANYAWGNKNINTNNITSITLFLLDNSQPASLVYDNIRVEKTGTPEKPSNPQPSNPIPSGALYDQFGQYTKQNWSGKITSDAQLKATVTNETADLNKAIAQYNSQTARTQYGGVKDESLRQKATGHFYTTKINGKWSFVDPEGYPYFATGVDVVRLSDGATWISGREGEFANMPQKGAAYSGHYMTLSNTLKSPNNIKTGTGYNFYAANLERKYGSNYIEAWKNVALKRFKAWGFTSLGCWSEPSLFFGKGNQTKMAYSANGWVTGNHKQVKVANSLWGTVADPFDPQFQVSVNKMLNEVKSRGVNEDPWCIGIYVDNEIGWGYQSDENRRFGLVQGVFSMDGNQADSYAKRQLVNHLKNKYGTIAKLNASWKTNIASWEVLTASYNGKLGDQSELLYTYAEKYYKTIGDSIDKILPNVMYMGSRFADWGAGYEVQSACAKHVDIMSYNCYKTDPIQPWMNLGKFDKPVIIGEFHFNATDHGHTAKGLVPVANQQARANAYTSYMTKAVNHNNLVGAHWFQYYDQPASGRAWDGENTNTGFVDITDQPFEEIVQAATNVNKNLYKIRFNAKG